jgi:hypothetical protein
MPTVLRSGPYRVFFYSSDAGEPPHVHVQRGPAEAKFWLNPVRLAHSTGYSPSEVRRIRSMITTEQSLLMEAWNEFFSGKC